MLIQFKFTKQYLKMEIFIWFSDEGKGIKQYYDQEQVNGRNIKADNTLSVY